MTIKCENCGESFNREGSNIYGTRCVYCGHVLKQGEKPKFVVEAEEKKKMLQAEMLERLRKKFKETK